MLVQIIPTTNFSFFSPNLGGVLLFQFFNSDNCRPDCNIVSISCEHNDIGPALSVAYPTIKSVTLSSCRELCEPHYHSSIWSMKTGHHTVRSRASQTPGQPLWSVKTTRRNYPRRRFASPYLSVVAPLQSAWVPPLQQRVGAPPHRSICDVWKKFRLSSYRSFTTDFLVHIRFHSQNIAPCQTRKRYVDDEVGIRRKRSFEREDEGRD